jgi:C_GCAxxG_C_C family probable redox protein
MGAFGGGLGGNGEVCGAVVGGLAALGIRWSRGLEEEKEDRRMWRFTDEFVRRFREEISPVRGRILCSEIIGVDWKNPEQVKGFYDVKWKICAALVGDTARLIGELLDRS